MIQPGITSERHFWEMEVGDAGSWDLEICRDKVTKKEESHASPVWFLGHHGL
jgi:hypothetical protein